MHHVEESEAETGGQLFDVGQGERAFVEQSLVHFALDDLVDHVLDALGRGTIQTARGAFHRIGQTDNSALLGLRVRARITEVVLAHGRHILGAEVHDFSAEAGILGLLQGALVEETDERVAVVLADDIDHAVVQFVFQRQIDTFFDVRNDDERTHGWREVVVRIDAARHVLGEIFRLHEFADVVEIRANAADGGVRTDGFRAGFGEVGHGKAVMVGAGRFKRHALEQRMVEVGRFQPGDVRGDAENVLEHWENSADQDGRAHPYAEGGQGLPSDDGGIDGGELRENLRENQTENGGENPNGEARVEAGPDQLAAAPHLQREEHGDHAGDERDDKEPRVDRRHEKRAPQADHHRAEQTEVAPEQNGENQRSERVRNQHRHELHIDAARVGQHEQAFDQGELREKDSVDQREAGITVKGLRMIDPQLRDGDGEDEQADEKLGLRRILRNEIERRGRGGSGKDQQPQAERKRGENDESREPAGGDRFTQRALLDHAAGARAGQAFFHQLLPMKEFEHGGGGAGAPPSERINKSRSHQGKGKPAGFSHRGPPPPEVPCPQGIPDWRRHRWSNG